jgi:hypothetical protein
MVSLIAATARPEHVGVFHRFELMRHWHQTQRLPFETFVSEDGLHMNDWSYACSARPSAWQSPMPRDPARGHRGRREVAANSDIRRRPSSLMLACSTRYSPFRCFTRSPAR